MEEVKKIAIFSADLGLGGTQRVLASLSNGLCDNDFEVDLLLVEKKGEYLKELNEKVNVVDLNSSRSTFSFLKLCKYLIVSRPKFCISSMDHLHIILCLANFVTLSKSTLFFRQPSSASGSYKRSKSHQTLIKKLQYTLLKLILPLAYSSKSLKAIIVPSREVKEDYVNFFDIDPSKIVIIPNLIDTEFVRKGAESKDNLFPNNKPFIISLARFSPEKDYETLIEAFKKVRKRRDVNLLLLGEGPERKQIVKMISEENLSQYILAPGFIDNPFSLLASASVFVLSSFEEGMPNALLQALCLGVPSISTDCNYGPREILNKGLLGALVEIGDSGEMAKSIVDGLDGKLKIMSEEDFDSLYSMGVVMRYYKNILNRP